MIHVTLETSYRYVGRGGVSRYIAELIPELRKLSPSIEVDEICCRIPNFSFQQPIRAAKTAYREYFWNRFVAPQQLARIKPDVFHMTCFPDVSAPPNIPRVVTLYDLSQLRYPKNYRRHTRARWKSHFAKMKEADAVIAISEFTRREGIEMLGISEEKIHAIPLAPTRLNVIDALHEDPDFSQRLPEDFFLFVGSLAPNKNLDLLLATYALARDRRIDLPPLVIVGIRIEGVTRTILAPDDWIFLEYIDDQALSRLYAKARALVYPSIYEGFGLPILEAMVANCPAVCSPVASLPEAGGDAACFAEPTPEAYLAMLTRLSEDDAFRDERILRGRQHAAGFTWKRTALLTAEVYRRVGP